MEQLKIYTETKKIQVLTEAVLSTLNPSAEESIPAADDLVALRLLYCFKDDADVSIKISSLRNKIKLLAPDWNIRYVSPYNEKFFDGKELITKNNVIVLITYSK